MPGLTRTTARAWLGGDGSNWDGNGWILEVLAVILIKFSVLCSQKVTRMTKKWRNFNIATSSSATLGPTITLTPHHYIQWTPLNYSGLTRTTAEARLGVKWSNWGQNGWILRVLLFIWLFFSLFCGQKKNRMAQKSEIFTTNHLFLGHPQPYHPHRPHH